MNGFLVDLGLFAIFFVIVYAYKRIEDYYYLKRLGLHENERVYLAAEEFAHGVPSDEVNLILADCFEFDEEDREEILSRAIPHRADSDGGYRAFIRAVNKAEGEALYDPCRRPAVKPDGPHTSSRNTSAAATVTIPPLSGECRRLLK